MKKNDYLLALCLFAIALFFGIFFFNKEKESGIYVCVYHQNELIGKYSLLTDGLYEIKVSEGFNLLEVHAGNASVIDSDCLTEECMHMKPISLSGERIVCLPHHLIFEVEGTKHNSSEVDGVTY